MAVAAVAARAAVVMVAAARAAVRGLAVMEAVGTG